VTKAHSDDDLELFREAMADVKPLDADPPPPERSRPAPRATFSAAESREVLHDSLYAGPDPGDVETGDELAFRRAGVPATDYRRLKRGRYSIRAELDLHGLTAVEAREALHAFLVECRQSGVGVVRVIHGKGLGSGPKGPVLKRRVGRWLRVHDEVLAYCSARPVDGGSGALYVLLRGSTRRPR
jgi:DNA-nicking Smr family endonuclease